MIIIHVADIRYERNDGIRTVLENLIPEQIKEGNNVFLFNIYKNENKKKYEYYIHDLRTFKYNIDKLHPDIVIFHSLYKFDYIRFSLYLSSCSIPYLIEPHGGTTELNHKKSYIAKKLADILFFNRIIKNAAGIIYLNNAEKEQCVFKYKRKKWCLVPNGINKINFKNINYTNGDSIKFVYLSRIDFAQKAIDYLLQAWNIFVSSHCSAELHIYGGCSDKNTEKRFNDLLCGSSNIFYHGDVRGDEKVKAYTGSNIFILTSRYEGMPMAIMEALSFGLPCLVTPNTNMSDLIIDNRCGWVCNLSVDDISHAMNLAINEYPRKFSYLAENARNSVVPFQWNIIAKLSVKEYLNILQC